MYFFLFYYSIIGNFYFVENRDYVEKDIKRKRKLGWKIFGLEEKKLILEDNVLILIFMIGEFNCN